METNFLGKLDRKVIVALLVWRNFQEREGTGFFIRDRGQKQKRDFGSKARYYIITFNLARRPLSVEIYKI